MLPTVRGLPASQDNERPFYGWVIVSVAAVVSFSQISFFNPVLGVFIQPLSDEFGWNRATISAAAAIGSLGGAVFSPLVGRVIDQQGPRLVVAAGGALMGICLLALVLTPGLWWFYLFYGIGRATAVGPTSTELTYLLAFEDAGQRERAWESFRNDPEWQKVRAASEEDGLIVKNVRNQLLNPTPYSPLQ